MYDRILSLLGGKHLHHRSGRRALLRRGIHLAAGAVVLDIAAPVVTSAQSIEPGASQNQALDARQSVLDSINQQQSDGSAVFFDQPAPLPAPVYEEPSLAPAPVLDEDTIQPVSGDEAALTGNVAPDDGAPNSAPAPTSDDLQSSVPENGIVVKDEASDDAAANGAGLPVIDDNGQLAANGASSYYAPTGHNVAEPFLSRWAGAGGVETLGAPLSEERYATGAGGVLQSFENLTLLYDASQQAPMDVRGQPLDKTIWLDIAPRDAFARAENCTTANCNVDGESGHTLAGAIGAFWQAWGDQAIFGRPLTEPFTDPAVPDAVAIQLFEHAVLEETAAGLVRLRPLGRELAEANGLMTDPAFVAAPPTGGQTYMVNADEGLRLRTAPGYDSTISAVLDNNVEFTAEAGWSGDWAPGYADGLSGFVDAQYLASRPPLPALDPSNWNPAVWQGAALSETNVRSEPETTAPIEKTLQFGDPLTVVQWVQGEEIYTDADLWGKLPDGGYVFGRNVGRNAPVLPTAIPPDAPASGRWIDVNLTQQLMTAYDGQSPLKTVPTSTGKAGWETPPGSYQILSRVANETMTSGAIGADNHYRLEDVLFTQYFTNQGHAIHFAWWRTPETIGRPGSHGCINILLEDARYFWDFADIGVPVIVHN